MSDSEGDRGQIYWVQVEPRRLYRAEINGATYELGYRGRAAAPQAGWYLLTDKGNVFMAKRLMDACARAAQELT